MMYCSWRSVRRVNYLRKTALVYLDAFSCVRRRVFFRHLLLVGGGGDVDV